MFVKCVYCYVIVCFVKVYEFYWNVVSLRMEEELAANAMKWGVSALDPEIFLCAGERIRRQFG